MESFDDPVGFGVVSRHGVELDAEAGCKRRPEVEVKTAPLSEVVTYRRTNLEIQPLRRAWRHLSVVAPCIGTSSGHLVALLMAVKRYL